MSNSYNDFVVDIQDTLRVQCWKLSDAQNKELSTKLADFFCIESNQDPRVHQFDFRGFLTLLKQYDINDGATVLTLISRISMKPVEPKLTDHVKATDAGTFVIDIPSPSFEPRQFPKAPN